MVLMCILSGCQCASNTVFVVVSCYFAGRLADKPTGRVEVPSNANFSVFNRRYYLE